MGRIEAVVAAEADAGTLVGVGEAVGLADIEWELESYGKTLPKGK